LIYFKINSTSDPNNGNNGNRDVAPADDAEDIKPLTTQQGSRLTIINNDRRKTNVD
jgi:hypothetical protein